MSLATAKNKLPIVGIIVVTTALGWGVSAPAHAYPEFPLAPACDKYSYPTQAFQLNQDNNIRVAMYLRDNKFFESPASYTVPGKPDVLGSVVGSLTGRNVEFTVNWNNGFSNRYTGQIADDGFARGTTTNNLNTANSWSSLDKFTCVAAPSASPAPAPSPAPKPAPVPATPTATVVADVDVFDLPDGREPSSRASSCAWVDSSRWSSPAEGIGATSSFPRRLAVGVGCSNRASCKCRDRCGRLPAPRRSRCVVKSAEKYCFSGYFASQAATVLGFCSGLAAGLLANASSTNAYVCGLTMMFA